MTGLDGVAQILSEADTAMAAGDPAAAERGLRQALKLQESRLGLEHPEVLNTLNDLGVVCDMLGRPDEAEFLYRRVLGIARETLPPDHPHIAISLENLTDLYEAQGETEKLRKLVGNRHREARLSELDSAQADRTTAAAEVTPDRDTEAVPASTAPALSGTTHSAGTAWRELLGRPGLVWGGTGAVLLVIGWLLYGGYAGSEGPAERPANAGTPGAAPAVVASRESAVVPDADEVTRSPEPGDVDSPPPPAPSLTTPSVVAAAEVCSRLVTQSADGAPLPQWTCDPVGDDASGSQLFFYTRIRSRTAATVQHLWFRDGVLQETIDLSIGVNDGPGYRTYSAHPLSPQRHGVWRVELRSSDRELLHAEEFVVR